MDEADNITRQRLMLWNTYHQWLAEAEKAGKLRRPMVPVHCSHNAHMYYVLLPDLERRTAFIDKLRNVGINTVFHYIPLHSSPAGQHYGRAHGDLKVTAEMSDRLVRLPLWVGLEEQQAEVIQQVLGAL